MREEYNILVSEDQIKNRVLQLAKQINNDYTGKTIDIICLVNSALIFTIDLIKHITIPTRLHLLSFTSYSEGNETGEIYITLDVAEPMFNRDVLVIEGIVISGKTPQFILELIRKRNPNSLALCALGIKPPLLNDDIIVNYVGFELGKKIAVGYGVGNGTVKTLPYLIEYTSKI